MLTFVGGAAFGITRINGWQWDVCLLCSLPCLPWAVLLRLVPDAYFGVVFNGVTSTFKVVLAPVSKALHFALLPVVQAWRAVMAPVKRASKRMAAKVRGKKAAADAGAEAAPVDEEVVVSSPMPPLTNLPPITLTAPSWSAHVFPLAFPTGQQDMAPLDFGLILELGHLGIGLREKDCTIMGRIFWVAYGVLGLGRWKDFTQAKHFIGAVHIG
jgi:hypothetical protein